MSTFNVIDSAYVLGINPFDAMNYRRGDKFLCKDEASEWVGSIIEYDSPVGTELAAFTKPQAAGTRLFFIFEVEYIETLDLGSTQKPE